VAKIKTRQISVRAPDKGTESLDIIILDRLAQRIAAGIYKTKKMYDSVLGKTVDAYQLPTAELHRDLPSQARRKDCGSTDIIDMENDLRANGQLEPVLVNSEGGVIFGHTRYRSHLNIFAIGGTIPGVEDDHVWVRGDFVSSKPRLKKIGMIENEHPANKKNTRKDIVTGILGLADDGEFDKPGEKFKDMSLADQQTRIIDWLKEEPYGPKGKSLKAWAAASRWKPLWQDINKGLPASHQKFRTWEKEAASIYFLDNNSYGINSKMWENMQIALGAKKPKKAFPSGTVFSTPNHGNVFVWLKSEVAGWLVKSSSVEALFHARADRVVMVATINEPTATQIKTGRKSVLQTISDWNVTQHDSQGNSTPSIHEALFMPQLSEETIGSNDLVISGVWAITKTKKGIPTAAKDRLGNKI
jgi:hypothetical protein